MRGTPFGGFAVGRLGGYLARTRRWGLGEEHRALVPEGQGERGGAGRPGHGRRSPRRPHAVHGLMHAPAAGRAITELVARGRSETFDLRPLRPSRFAEGDLVIES